MLAANCHSYPNQSKSQSGISWLAFLIDFITFEINHKTHIMLRPKRPNLLKRIAKIFLVFFVLLNIMIAFQAYRTTYFYEQGEVPFQKFTDKTTLQKISTAILGAKISKREMNDTPTNPFEVVKLKDSDGYVLEGWYVATKNPKGTVALFHGHASSKSQVVREADYFHELGFNTFALDARSHGNSAGNVCTVGYSETEGIKLAYDWIRTKGEKNIVLWGASMGAAMVIKAVPEYNLKPEKIIIDCPFASMHDAVKGFLRNMKIPTTPLSEMLMFYGSIERGYWAFDYKPEEYAKGIKNIPVLMQWGRKDLRVQQHETDLIFNKLGSIDKQLIIYEDSGHESYCKKENLKWKGEMKRFLE
jgi:uncharacterized protein